MAAGQPAATVGLVDSLADRVRTVEVENERLSEVASITSRHLTELFKALKPVLEEGLRRDVDALLERQREEREATAQEARLKFRLVDDAGAGGPMTAVRQ